MLINLQSFFQQIGNVADFASHFTTVIPAPPIKVVYLGPVPLRFYMLVILCGIIVALWWTDRRYRRKGGPAEVTLDVGAWAVIFGIIGARLYHVITSPAPYFGPNGDLSKILRVWEGGLGIWGGIAFGAIAATVALHRQNLRLGAFADAVAPALLLAQGIGRFGNYFNQELYGKPTDLPWALAVSPSHLPQGYAVGTTFHPTFLYEAIWCFIGAAILVVLQRKYKLDGGRLMLIYVMYYTLGRVWIEALRIDEAQIIAGLRLNVWTSMIVFVVAAFTYLFYTRHLAKNRQLADIYLHPVEDEVETNSTEAKTASQALAEAEKRYAIG